MAKETPKTPAKQQQAATGDQTPPDALDVITPPEEADATTDIATTDEPSSIPEGENQTFKDDQYTLEQLVSNAPGLLDGCDPYVADVALRRFGDNQTGFFTVDEAKKAVEKFNANGAAREEDGGEKPESSKQSGEEA